ncbi:hypothetical protein CIW50_28355 [Tardiphaga sp. P9-11]|nr:hypothetical protein CIW50_28355 [Tardiphaga sp. P9-11]
MRHRAPGALNAALGQPAADADGADWAAGDAAGRPEATAFEGRARVYRVDAKAACGPHVAATSVPSANR